MEIPADIERYVHRNFQESDVAGALRILRDASLHDGTSPDPRMLRCALVASRNSLESLENQVAGLAIDYRDVILAGEYTRENGDFVQTRDLSRPFDFESP